MRNSVSILASILLVSAIAPAAAGPLSVAVSRNGANSASCGSVASPCRTLQYAHNLVDPGGKIDILDSAEYGSLSISKSVSVVYAGRGVALVTPSAAGKNAILVNATPSDTVSLRGLTIDGAGTGLNGVLFNAGARIEMVDCAVYNFTNFGVHIAAPNGNFSIVRTSIANNAVYGVRAFANGATVKGDADELRLYGNGAGGLLLETAGGGTVEATVSNSVSSGHRTAPGAAFRANGLNARITLRESIAMDNAAGVSATNGGLVRISRMILSGNDAAAIKTGGLIETFGDNIIARNSNDALGALTPVALR